MELLNLRRLLCPMPVIKTQNFIKNSLNHDDIFQIVATDPGVLQDIPCWCRINRHNVLDIKQEEYDIFITIQVSKHE